MSPSWNIYGSESERFVIHLQFQESAVRSECSKRKCPRKRRVLHSTEILLGDINDSSSGCITLQDSLSQWEVATELPCSGERCRGTQSFSQRQFTYGAPPVLVLSVSYLSQLRGFTVEKHPRRCPSYRIEVHSFWLYTMNTGDHFVGYFRRGSFWCRYDGLKNPEIIQAHKQGSGKLEHILLVIDVPRP
ncbi:uncharacterized protein C14orf28-like [Argopecten irradians]|uniref:uncharacterized protein C14orf28-like n=1 Tax=Argopecten irradians TaxID=31199 RepID=UPI00372289DF